MWGKVALGFETDRIRTLISMGTDSSQDMHKLLDELEIRSDLNTELAALERLITS